MERVNPEPYRNRGPTPFHPGRWVFGRYLLLLGERRANCRIGANKKVDQPYLIRREDGFTLNEILASIALISISILGVTINTVTVIQFNYFSKNFTTATYLAQDKIEQLKSLAPLKDVDNCVDPPEKNITATGTSGGIFGRCWTIKGSPLGAGLREITVIVSWRDYISRNVTLSSLVFTE